MPCIVQSTLQSQKVETGHLFTLQVITEFVTIKEILEKGNNTILYETPRGPPPRRDIDVMAMLELDALDRKVEFATITQAE